MAKAKRGAEGMAGEWAAAGDLRSQARAVRRARRCSLLSMPERALGVAPPLLLAPGGVSEPPSKPPMLDGSERLWFALAALCLRPCRV
jgi:hypothetical protein